MPVLADNLGTLSPDGDITETDSTSSVFAHISIENPFSFLPTFNSIVYGDTDESASPDICVLPAASLPIQETTTTFVLIATKLSILANGVAPVLGPLPVPSPKHITSGIFLLAA